MLFGTGLQADIELRNGRSIPNGTHLPADVQFTFGVTHTFVFAGLKGLTARFDVINLFDEKYEIRVGTGVGAPQWGPRRGFLWAYRKRFDIIPARGATVYTRRVGSRRMELRTAQSETIPFTKRFLGMSKLEVLARLGRERRKSKMLKLSTKRCAKGALLAAFLGTAGLALAVSPAAAADAAAAAASTVVAAFHGGAAAFMGVAASTPPRPMDSIAAGSGSTAAGSAALAASAFAAVGGMAAGTAPAGGDGASMATPPGGAVITPTMATRTAAITTLTTGTARTDH